MNASNDRPLMIPANSKIYKYLTFSIRLLLTRSQKSLYQRAMTNIQTKPSTVIRLLKYHFPVFLYAACILYLSSIPSFKTPTQFPPGVDKLAHLIEYAVFAWIVFRSFYDLLGHRSTRLVVIIGAVFILIFAAMDELFQGTIPGRHQDPIDLAFDFIGGIIVLALLGLRTKRRVPSDQQK